MRVLKGFLILFSVAGFTVGSHAATVNWADVDGGAGSATLVPSDVWNSGSKIISNFAGIIGLSATFSSPSSNEDWRDQAQFKFTYDSKQTMLFLAPAATSNVLNVSFNYPISGAIGKLGLIGDGGAVEKFAITAIGSGASMVDSSGQSSTTSPTFTYENDQNQSGEVDVPASGTLLTYNSVSQFTITYTCVDQSGACGSVIVDWLINEVTLSSTSPVDNATNVDPTTDIVLNFNEDVKAGSGNITVSNGTDIRTIPVGDAQVSFSGKSMTINLTNDLTGGSNYHVKVDATAVTNLNGQAYAGISNTTAFNFRTLVPDTTAPTVSVTGPSGVATGPLTVTITFSEEVEGFEFSDIVIANGSADPDDFEVTTAGTVWTLLVTPEFGKTLTVNIAAGVAQDLAGNDNLAADEYSIQAGSPEYEFNKRREEVRNVIRDQAVRKLGASVRASNRMMSDVRDRMILATNYNSDGSAGTAEAAGYIPFDVNGTLNASADMNGVVVAAAGNFLGQTGFREGVNYRLFGNFDVYADDKDGLLTTMDVRVLREQLVTNNLMLGIFGGGDYGDSRIRNSYGFDGKQDSWTVFGGGYFVTQLVKGFYIDGFGSVGYGKSDLSMSTDLENDNVLQLDSDYDTLTWQVGGSMTGVVTMDFVEFRPNLTAIYGNTELGKIDFKARAYGLSDDVSLDAGSVEMGTLRFTPEVRFALDTLAGWENTATISVLPALVCEHVVGVSTRTDCGGGVGVGFSSGLLGSSAIISMNVDYERVGDVDRVGGHAEFTYRF